MGQPSNYEVLEMCYIQSLLYSQRYIVFFLSLDKLTYCPFRQKCLLNALNVNVIELKLLVQGGELNPFQCWRRQIRCH